MACLLTGITVHCYIHHIKVYTNVMNIHARCKNGEIHKLCRASVSNALVGFPFFYVFLIIGIITSATKITIANFTPMFWLLLAIASILAMV
ncbi:MAG: hypothetical protein PHY36_01840 [Methanocellales archaeon]|nr:hypothetical protein [Methanocellales archaeon]